MLNRARRFRTRRLGGPAQLAVGAALTPLMAGLPVLVGCGVFLVLPST